MSRGVDVLGLTLQPLLAAQTDLIDTLLAEVERLRAENVALRERLTITPEKVEAAAVSLRESSQTIWDAWEFPRDQNWHMFAYPALLAAGMEEPCQK